MKYLVADFSAQAIINTYLHKAFPNDPIIGEEDSKDLRGDDGKVLREKVHSLTNGVLDDSEKLSEEQVMIYSYSKIRLDSYEWILTRLL